MIERNYDCRKLILLEIRILAVILWKILAVEDRLSPYDVVSIEDTVENCVLFFREYCENLY